MAAQDKDIPFDSEAGWPSRETGTDPIIGKPGSHQWLGDDANHHDGSFERIIVERSNTTEGIPKFDTGFIPAITEGKPSAVNPTGVGGSASEDESGEGAGEGGSGGE